MSSIYDAQLINVRALKDHVLITNMNFGERTTVGGIVLQSDNAKSHGVRPRWGKVYKVGPEQTDVQVGQWILVEHGRWTRGVKINDGDGEKIIQRVDPSGIMLVSDDEPTSADDYISDTI